MSKYGNLGRIDKIDPLIIKQMLYNAGISKRKPASSYRAKAKATTSSDSTSPENFNKGKVSEKPQEGN